jgi:hypothetical protein
MAEGDEMDTVKTVGNGIIGVSVWYVQLPILLQMAVSTATFIYIIIKTMQEFHNYKNRK